MANMILPGTYIEVRPEGLIAPGQVTVGNVGIVGTASKGPKNHAVVLGSFTDAKAIFYPYDKWVDGKSNELTLVRALEQAFNHGASTVFAVRVTDGSDKPASYTVKAKDGDCVLLTANSSGIWGNDLRIQVTAAAGNAFVSNEQHNGPSVKLNHSPVKSPRNRVSLFVAATNTTKSLAIVDSSPVAGQVSFDPDGTMHFADAVTAADQVTASYLVASTNAATVTIQLLQAKETYLVVDGNDLAQQIADPQTGSAWVSAQPLANAGEIPVLVPPAADPTAIPGFTGGLNGGASATDYQAGLDAILNEEVHIVVAAGQDDSFGAKLDQHCQNASTDAVKHDRIGVIGSKLKSAADSPNDFLDKVIGHTLDSDRLIFVAPGIQSTDAASGQEVTLPGSYAAAAVAGMLAALPAHVSLTNKPMPVDGLEQVFTNAQLEQLVENRVLALEQHLGFRVVKGITTSTGSAFSQITTRRIVDFAKFVVRAAADPFIGLLNNDRVRQALRASIDSGLKQMVKDEMLITYDLSVSATRDQQIRGIAEVDITLQPTFSIDFIKVTLFLE
jgi:hypothetical protein